MLSLVIDTAGPCCSAALAGNDGVVASESERIERGHAERLMPIIDAIFARSGRTYSDLDRIGVTTGPGSFTGVRIGVATARGLAIALDVEAFGIGVLDVIAEQARSEMAGRRAKVLATVLPAARGDVFMQAISITPEGKEGVGAKPLLPATRLTADDARQWIGRQEGAVVLTGSGATAIDRDDLLLSGASVTADHADIGFLAALALRGAGTSPPRPLYLRAPDARPQTGKAVEHA